MAGSPQERVLAAEMLVVMGVQTADALTGADTGSAKLPDPSRYFATVIVYLMLAGMAMFGEKPGRLATSFGGVAALTILIAPTKKTGKPLVNSLLVYFNQIMTGGLQQPAEGPGGGPPTPVDKPPSGSSGLSPPPVSGTPNTSPVFGGLFPGPPTVTPGFPTH